MVVKLDNVDQVMDRIYEDIKISWLVSKYSRSYSVTRCSLRKIKESGIRKSFNYQKGETLDDICLLVKLDFEVAEIRQNYFSDYIDNGIRVICVVY